VIWLTWRQFRMQVAVVFGIVAVIAVALAVTGPNLVHLYDTTVATCSAHGDCSAVTNAFTSHDGFLQKLGAVLTTVVGALIGMFWGAPLVARELETGTYRLAWTQSATRARWLAVKLGLLGLASVLVAGLLSLMVTWWSSPIDRVTMNLYSTFDQRGIVAVGYAAFAFALGVTAGVLIRRTLPAMAATLVAFVAVRLSFTIFLRPHLIAPIHDVTPMNPMVMGFGIFNGGAPMLLPNPPNLPNAWLYSVQIVDNADHALTPQVLADSCPSLVALGPRGGPPIGPAHRAVLPAPAALQQALHTCVAKLSTTYHEVTTYQPSSRYWTFQGLETAIYVALAVVLGAGCFWWVRHRLT
jgi:ABC-type transport system involved in multi-copper enzyme maturation permease subunit